VGAGDQRRINQATVVTPTGCWRRLAGGPQKAASESDLREQVGAADVAARRPRHGATVSADRRSRAVLDWAEPIGGVSRIAHEWGDLIAADRAPRCR